MATLSRDRLVRAGPGSLQALSLDVLGATAPPRESLAALSDDQLDRWLEFARRNQIEPMVTHALLERLPDHPRRGAWQQAHDRSSARVGVLMDELDRVAERLEREGIAVVALKNAGIARGLYCPGCCPMGDVDLLVDRSRYGDAHRVMLASGYTLDTRSVVEEADLEHGLVSGGTEYYRHVGEHEVWMELQWRPIAGRWIRPEMEPSGSELLRRSVPIEGTSARLLAPEDNMLQVCLHTAKHTYVRGIGIRLHTDVDRLAARAAPDWDRLIETMRGLQVVTASYFSLALAQALLGSAVPERVLAELAPARWKIEAVSRWLAHVDLFEPDERKFSRLGMLAFHALLYDDRAGLASSLFDTDREHLRLRDLPANLRSGTKRVLDLLTRFQR